MNSMKYTQQQMRTLCAVLNAEYINAKMYNKHLNDAIVDRVVINPSISEDELKAQLDAARFFAEDTEYEDCDEIYDNFQTVLLNLQKNAEKLSEILLQYDFTRNNPLMITIINKLRISIKTTLSNTLVVQPNERNEFLIYYLENYLSVQADYTDNMREMLQDLTNNNHADSPDAKTMREIIVESEKKMSYASSLLNNLSHKG